MESARIWGIQESAEPRDPELLLWRAVVALTVKDFRNTHSEGHADAVAWLTSDRNRDRRLVCDLAGVDERGLTRWARAYYWDMSA